MNPKIGIIVCGFTDGRQFVTDTYVEAVRSSGGLPFIIPCVESDSLLKEAIAYFDGFLFCGGADITPLLFYEEPLPGIGATDLKLDTFQLQLMKQILNQTTKPVLGICRGMQVLNVACGGTLYQDISHQPGAPFNHMQLTTSREDISHQIDLEKSSALYKLLGPSTYTNSFHHQTIHEVGSDLIIAATTCDGTIEAVEMPSHPFVIGVQWHPECMLNTSPGMQHLFSTFIQMGR